MDERVEAGERGDGTRNAHDEGDREGDPGEPLDGERPAGDSTPAGVSGAAQRDDDPCAKGEGEPVT